MNLAVLYVSLQHNTAPKFVRARQAFLALGHALLPIVRDAEKGLRNPKPVAETTPLTFPHTILENDFDSSSQLATHPAVLALRCRDLVAFPQHALQITALYLDWRGLRLDGDVLTALKLIVTVCIVATNLLYIFSSVVCMTSIGASIQ